MFDGILKKLFGDKNQKDLNELFPVIDSTNQFSQKLIHISDDELRAKTDDFKKAINKAVEDSIEEKKNLKEKASSVELGISEKEAIYDKIDALEVQENELNCQNSCFSGTLREYWR